MAKTYTVKISATAKNGSPSKAVTPLNSKPAGSVPSDIGRVVVAKIDRDKLSPILEGDGLFDAFDMTGVVNKDFSDLNGALNLSAGVGNDTVTGTNYGDTLAGGKGADTLVGGKGNDRLTLGDSTGNDNAGNLAFGDSMGQGAWINSYLLSASNIYLPLDQRVGFYSQAALEAEKDPFGNVLPNSAGGNDWIRGGSSNDTEFGGGGNDTLIGGGGDDVLLGGQGSDKINGDDGNDTIIGGGNVGSLSASARDTLHGDGGNDVISAFAGEAYGDAGNDTIISEGSGDLFIDGGAGNDLILGSNSAETIVSSSGKDTINAGGGDDLIILDSIPDAGSIIDGGSGTDTVRIRVTSFDDDKSLSDAFSNRNSSNNFAWHNISFKGIQKLEIIADYTVPVDNSNNGNVPNAGGHEPNSGDDTFSVDAVTGKSLDAGAGNDNVIVTNAFAAYVSGGQAILIDGGAGDHDVLTVVANSIYEERAWINYAKGLRLLGAIGLPLQYTLNNWSFQNFEYFNVQRNFQITGQNVTLNDANGVNPLSHNVSGSITNWTSVSSDQTFAGNDTVTVGDKGHGTIMMLEGDDQLILKDTATNLIADGGDGNDRLIVQVGSSASKAAFQAAFDGRDQATGQFTYKGNIFRGFEELELDNSITGQVRFYTESTGLNASYAQNAAYAGNDTITVGDTGHGSINTADGDDQLFITNKTNGIVADGGDGNDILVVDAGNGAMETQWRDAWNNQSAQRLGAAKSFKFNGNSNTLLNNFVNFEQLAFVNSFIREDNAVFSGGPDLYTYTGNDTVTVATNAKGRVFLGYDDDIANVDFNTTGVTVDGGDGYDRLVLKVHSNAQKTLAQTAYDAHDANGNFVIGGNTFKNFEALDFDTSDMLVYQAGPTNGNDTVTVGSGLAWDPSIDYQNLLDGNDVFDATKATANQHFTVNGGGGNDTIKLGAGGSSVDGGDGDDTIIGGAGNDTIVTYRGKDNIDGGYGDDSIIGSGCDAIYVYGGYGNDRIDLWTNAAINGNSSALGGNGNDTIVASRDMATFIDGGGDNDQLFGENGDDTINGSGGDDIIYGNGEYYNNLHGKPNDNVSRNDSNLLDGGDGNDQIYGAGGNDTLSGGRGDDTLDGLDGNDVLAGGTGADNLSGGAGDDKLYMSADHFSDGTLQIGFNARRAGASSYGFNTSNANAQKWDFYAQITTDFVMTDDYFNGGDGRDALIGLNSNDYISYLDSKGNKTFEQIEYFNTGEGSDIINLAGYTNSSVEVHGGDGNDLVIGSDSSASLYGDDGNDTIASGAGNDCVNGGSGDDMLIAGLGNDTLIGGSGADTFVFTPGNGRTSYISDFNEKEGDKIVLYGILLGNTSVEELQTLPMLGSSDKFFHFYGTVKDNANANAYSTFDVYVRENGYVGLTSLTGLAAAQRLAQNFDFKTLP